MPTFYNDASGNDLALSTLVHQADLVQRPATITMVASGSASFFMVEPEAAGRAAIDICATHPGKHIAYRYETNVLVYSTLSEGASWSVALVATDAAETSNAAIASDRYDNLYCAYFTDADEVRIHLSQDLGASWALWRVLTGGRFPRMHFGHDRHYLAVWDVSSTEILVFDSMDFLETTGAAVLTMTLAEQLVDLAVDRRGGVHVFYSDSGLIYRRFSTDGITWGSPALMAAGTCPAFAVNPIFGTLLWFSGDILYGRRTTSDFQGLVGSPIPITSTITPQCLGFTWDRRENPWVVWIFVDDPVPVPPDYPQLQYAPGSPVDVPSDAPGQFTADPDDMMELGFGAEEITTPPQRLDAVETP